ncbi:MAG TPA: hypothetical protein DEG47_08455, partial [Cyanobacteria bacterium UBA11148]|nr:hypothetical protein [Cyanobacteria bacterium UBA11148]
SPFPVPFEYKQESGQALNISQFYGWQDIGINLCKIEKNSPTSMLDQKLTQLKTIFAEMERALIA